MRRILKIMLLIPLLYVVAMPFYFRHTGGLGVCGGLNVIINDSIEYRFVDRNQITDKINSSQHKFAGVPTRDISLDAIEKSVAEIVELKVIEAYLSIDGILHVEVDQRNPLIRVSSTSGMEYYIDDEGYIIKKRGLLPPRVLIAGGKIDLVQNRVAGKKVWDKEVPGILKDLYELVNFLNSSPMWSAMIDQIEVNAGGEIVLIPRTGGHTVLLGGINDLGSKFSSLEAMYKDVFPVTGWEMYSLINLKYSGQIVCKKR